MELIIGARSSVPQNTIGTIRVNLSPRKIHRRNRFVGYSPSARDVVAGKVSNAMAIIRKWAGMMRGQGERKKKKVLTAAATARNKTVRNGDCSQRRWRGFGELLRRSHSASRNAPRQKNSASRLLLRKTYQSSDLHSASHSARSGLGTSKAARRRIQWRTFTRFRPPRTGLTLRGADSVFATHPGLPCRSA